VASLELRKVVLINTTVNDFSYMNLQQNQTNACWK